MNFEQKERLFKGKSFVAKITVDKMKLFNRATAIFFGMTDSEVHYTFNEDYTGTTTTREVGRIELPPPQYYFVWKVEQDTLTFTGQDGHEFKLRITESTPLTLTPESPNEFNTILWYNLEEKNS